MTSSAYLESATLEELESYLKSSMDYLENLYEDQITIEDEIEDTLEHITNLKFHILSKGGVL